MLKRKIRRLAYKLEPVAQITQKDFIEQADAEIGWEVAEQLDQLLKLPMLDVGELNKAIKQGKLKPNALKDIYDFCKQIRKCGSDTEDNLCLETMLYLEEWAEAHAVDPDIKKHISPVWSE